MNYRILTVKDEVDWDLALKRLPIDQQDIYFTSQYYKLYQQNGDGEARCFIYENDGKILLYPFLINSVNSLGMNWIRNIMIYKAHMDIME